MQKEFTKTARSTRTETGPPPLYRHKLFGVAQRRRSARQVALFGFRVIAAETGLSVNTVRSVFAGQASKLEPIAILAKYFEIDWLVLFDTDKRLIVEPAGDPSGKPIAVTAAKS